MTALHKVETHTSIRAATRSDSAELGSVHVAAWRATYRGILTDDYLDSMSETTLAAYWESILSDVDRGIGVYVAQNIRGKIIGFADSGPERAGPPRFGEVMALYLLPRWRNLGIGRRLVQKCAQQLAKEGFTALAIWTLIDNPARDFYAALGGTPAEQRITSIGGTKMVEQCYRWTDIRTHLANK